MSFPTLASQPFRFPDIKFANHLWDITSLMDRMETHIGNPPSTGITKTYPLLHTHTVGEWISVVPLVDSIVIANKKEINHVYFNGEFKQKEEMSS